MRTKKELKGKITELYNADLDRMVTDEVEYGVYWLEWVLGKHEHETILKQVKKNQWWPISEGKAMSAYQNCGKDLYYAVLGEDFLRDKCQTCNNIKNMKFGWKSQQGMPLFVCSNIEEIKPTITEPIQWNARLCKGAECPSYQKSI